MNEGSHCIGKLIQRPDTGKIPPVDGVGSRDVLVVPGKHADDGDIQFQEGTHFNSRILNPVGLSIIYIVAVLIHFDDVVWFDIREKDHQLMFTWGVFQPFFQRTNSQAVPITACGKVIEDSIIPVGFLLVSVPGDDSIAADRT